MSAPSTAEATRLDELCVDTGQCLMARHAARLAPH
jgi:hypothetical protein